MVDAAEDEFAAIGPGDGKADVHAIDGNAVNGVCLDSAVFDRIDAKWISERHRVSAGGAFAVGGDDLDFSYLPGCLGKDLEAVAVDAVVVGDQDSHAVSTLMAVAILLTHGSH